MKECRRKGWGCAKKVSEGVGRKVRYDNVKEQAKSVLDSKLNVSKEKGELEQYLHGTFKQLATL